MLMVAGETEKFKLPSVTPPPLLPVITGWPSTVSPAPPVTNRTPPLARTLKEFVVSELKGVLSRSDHTKAPELVARAALPAAKLVQCNIDNGHASDSLGAWLPND